MLVQTLGLVDLKSDSILGEKKIGKIIDFLNGLAVSPKNDLLIVFDRKQYCLDVSEGKDLSCNIKTVLLSKSKNEFEAYDLFYKYLNDKYEDIKMREVSLNIGLDGIYSPPISYAMATLYSIPEFVLDDTFFSSLIAFFYGYIFGFKFGQMKNQLEFNLERMFYEVKEIIEEINLLADTQLEDKQQWKDFFTKYEIKLRKKKGKTLDEIFHEKKQNCFEQHYFW